jgi:hypothetical protein
VRDPFGSYDGYQVLGRRERHVGRGVVEFEHVERIPAEVVDVPDLQ